MLVVCDARVVEALPKALLALPRALAIALVSLPSTRVSDDEMSIMAVALDAAAETTLEMRLETAAGRVDEGKMETKVAAPATDSETEGVFDTIGEALVSVVIVADVLAEVDNSDGGAELETGNDGAGDVDIGEGGAATTDVDATGAAPAIVTLIAIPASAGLRLLAVWKLSTSKAWPVAGRSLAGKEPTC